MDLCFMSIKIVHVASTPLVGAPAKIAAAQRMAGYDAISIYENDYPQNSGLAGKFVDDSLKFNSGDVLIESLILDKLSKSDIVHVHNTISLDLISFIKRNSSSARFVYHVHSPLREGPLYIERQDHLGLPFDKLLAVSQYQPRHYPKFIPVPNIVLSIPRLSQKNDKDSLRVMYSPSHRRGGRWNSKYSESLDNAVSSLKKNKKIDVITPVNPLHPSLLMEVRKSCHVSIDEIATGAYHQVSLEGLCAGNVVINKADYFSKAMLARYADNKMPPFVYADDNNIFDILNDLANDTKKVNDIKKASFEYFANHLMPQKLIQIYIDIYKDVI